MILIAINSLKAVGELGPVGEYNLQRQYRSII